MFRHRFIIALFIASFAELALAQGRGGPPPQAPPASTDGTPRVETAGEKEEKISQTSHALRLDGRDIKYKR